VWHGNNEPTIEGVKGSSCLTEPQSCTSEGNTPLCVPHKQDICLTYPFLDLVTGHTCFLRPHITCHTSEDNTEAPTTPIPVNTAHPCPSFLHFLLIIPVGPDCNLSPLPTNWLLLPSLHPAFITKPYLWYQVGHNTATLKTVAPFSSKISIVTYKTTVSQHTRPYLTFRGPCIMIYFYNKSQQDALFLNFILVNNSSCFGQTYCPS